MKKMKLSLAFISLSNECYKIKGKNVSKVLSFVNIKDFFVFNPDPAQTTGRRAWGNPVLP